MVGSITASRLESKAVKNEETVQLQAGLAKTQTRPMAMDQNEEARLLAKCVDGDKAAWDTLVRRYEKCVYRFAFNLCHDRDDAEDISAHVFIRVFQNLHTFRNEACFSSWLFRIVRNTHLDMCVRPAWRSHVSLDTDLAADLTARQTCMREIADPTPTPEAQSIKKEVVRMLNQAVSHLPGYQREVLKLYHADGKSYEQIAETTGLSIGTVKSRINRARAMLRERLMPYRDTFIAN
jgi:RNA polymerase sigma-70 factor (ECF subfamily)